jgi:hypothetical protein
MSLISWILVVIACLLAGREIGKVISDRTNGANDGKRSLSGIKRDAQALAIKLREYGLKLLPTVLEDLVVGDVVDLFNKIKELAAIVRAGDEAVLKELDGTYERVLEKKLATKEGRAVLQAKLAEADANVQ